jgi:hypothetical protein
LDTSGFWKKNFKASKEWQGQEYRKKRDVVIPLVSFNFRAIEIIISEWKSFCTGCEKCPYYEAYDKEGQQASQIQ